MRDRLSRTLRAAVAILARIATYGHACYLGGLTNDEIDDLPD